MNLVRRLVTLIWVATLLVTGAFSICLTPTQLILISYGCKSRKRVLLSFSLRRFLSGLSLAAF